MAELPYFLLDVADYEADTVHLSIAEDGTFIRLLRLCWRQPGHAMPNDAEWIKRKMRASDEEYSRLIEPIIAEFFAVQDGRIFSERLLTEADGGWQE